MAGCFGNHPEDRAREAELNRYLDKQSEGDEMDNLVEDMMHQATHDAALFRTYDDDYEVIDRDQVMRCLANLDKACSNFNRYALIPDEHRYEIDAIFTALSIMQTNLQKAVEHEAEKALESQREMACYDGE